MFERQGLRTCLCYRSTIIKILVNNKGVCMKYIVNKAMTPANNIALEALCIQRINLY